MSKQLSLDEHILLNTETTGGSLMESNALEKIKEMKEIKAKTKITYIDIMEEMQEIDESSMVSLSTLRRIFRDGSEMKAKSFNYEEILIPVYNAVKALELIPKPESLHDKELDGYKAVIRVQNEELDRLLELKEHLDSRVDFLVAQITKKDELINYLVEQQKAKDEVIHKLMEKCL